MGDDGPLMKEDGLMEQHFLVNFFSMVLLIRGLQPLLESSSVPECPARIVITGSFTTWSFIKGTVDFDNLQGQKATDTESREEGAGGPNSLMYAQAKLLQHMWAKHMATLLQQNVHINVYDPGLVASNLENFKNLRRATGCCWPCLKKAIGLRSTSDGASPGIYCCTSPVCLTCLFVLLTLSI